MSLRETTFSAARWTTVATAFRAALQVAQTMVLARLLLPEDFGLMAMAGVVVAIATLLADFGLGSALMHFPQPDRTTFSTIYWLNLGLSCGLALLFALLAWPVAHAYDQPGLLPVLCALSLTFPLAAVGLPFRVMAEKDLRFPSLARQEIGAALAGFVVALAVAIAGGGVFAFVAAALTTTAMSSGLAWLGLSKGTRPAGEFSLARARPFLAFGLHRVGSNLWNTLSLQADVFIAGLHATPAQTAFYAVPREQCLRIANTVVNPVVTRVGLPVMTRLRQDQATLRSVYLQTLRMTASLNFPMYALLALFAEPVVLLLFGDRWLDSVFYMRLFALWGMIRSTGNPSGSLVFAVGMVRRVHIWNLLHFVVTVPVLWVAVKAGGLAALALVMCGLQCLVFVLLWRVLIWPACGARFLEYGAQLAAPMICTALASAFAFAVTMQLPWSWRLPIGAILFGISYLALSWRINRAWFSAMIKLCEPLRARRA